MQTSEIVKNSEWSHWTPTEEAYLVEHQKESDDDVAAKLGCSSSRVRRKRYALRLLKTEDQKREIRKKARNKQADVWDCQLIVLHSHAASLLAEFGSKEAYKRLKLVIDDIGPQRSISAIQSKCNALGYGESGEHRRQRLESIRTAAAYGKLRCRQIPHTWNWYDLSSLTQTIILFSVLGDASLPKPTSGSHHYYTETKKLAHKPYLLWKRELLPKKFRGNFYEDNPLKKRYPRCTWETGVSQIFTTLRTHLYPKTEGGFKSIISHWVIEQKDTLDELALLGLLIWLLDDGRNSMRHGYPNLEICIERWEFALRDVERVCGFFNTKFGLHLYVRSGSKKALNTLCVPADDRDRLVPIWRRHSVDYRMPECMDYKFPRYALPRNGPSRRLRWEQIDPERRQGLAEATYKMRRAGQSFREIGRFLENEGHPLKTTARYLPGVWKRLNLDRPT